ncbi:NUDIX hydrolase [Arenibacterium sp. LLYu02]|uniref:NUDIX hydrolase n=1 Tax=Arenibacterium sp. LLYu02 TaxID=3404132 RepID=UPI003B21D998
MRPQIERSAAAWLPTERDYYRQIAALCYQVSSKGRVQVLLVTSRGTGRWIIPKGWPMEGLTGPQAAAREAWEEAGVRGQISSSIEGHFTYSKLRRNAGPMECLVEVHGLRVTSLATDYPERNQRLRDWVSPQEAAERVAEPALAALLRQFAPAQM